MTRMTDLNNLAERAEKATGHDREIDLAILRIVDPERIPYMDARFAEMKAKCEENGLWPLRESAVRRDAYYAPRYTASLDAAMTLVPEGGLFTARTIWDGSKTVGLGVVSRYETDAKTKRRYWMDDHHTTAATPALALVAAALKSRAQQGEGR